MTNQKSEINSRHTWINSKDVPEHRRVAYGWMCEDVCVQYASVVLNRISRLSNLGKLENLSRECSSTFSQVCVIYLCDFIVEFLSENRLAITESVLSACFLSLSVRGERKKFQEIAGTVWRVLYLCLTNILSKNIEFRAEFVLTSSFANGVLDYSCNTHFEFCSNGIKPYLAKTFSSYEAASSNCSLCLQSICSACCSVRIQRLWVVLTLRCCRQFDDIWMVSTAQFSY